MILALVVAGAVAEAVVWWLVSRKRVSVWTGLGPVLAVAGLAALVTGRVSLSPRASWPVAAAVGAGAGVILFAATTVFVRVVVRLWPPFESHAEAIYSQGQDLPLPAFLALALGLAVAGEELFWRGLVQGRAAQSQGRVGGALIAWGAYVVANLPSRSLAIVAGAVVGGAVWAGLAFWTGGVLASLLCHAVWTGLMIVEPPVGSR